MHHADAGHHVEQLADYMGPRPDSARRPIDLAGIGLCMDDKLGNRLCGNRRVYEHDVGLAIYSRDRRARAGQSFLLSLHFNAPHWPWEAPGDQAESERLRGRRLDHWDGGSQETYRRMIAALDV